MTFTVPTAVVFIGLAFFINEILATLENIKAIKWLSCFNNTSGKAAAEQKNSEQDNFQDEVSRESLDRLRRRPRRLRGSSGTDDVV